MDKFSDLVVVFSQCPPLKGFVISSWMVGFSCGIIVMMVAIAIVKWGNSSDQSNTKD